MEEWVGVDRCAGGDGFGLGFGAGAGLGFGLGAGAGAGSGVGSVVVGVVGAGSGVWFAPARAPAAVTAQPATVAAKITRTFR